MKKKNPPDMTQRFNVARKKEIAILRARLRSLESAVASLRRIIQAARVA